MISYYLMFPVVRSSLVFSGLGLKSPASGFQSYSSSSLKSSPLLQLYSTDNKTSRLMVKRFSTLRDTQRGSRSYMKKRRGRKELEIHRRRKKGDSRGERQIYTIICSQSVLRSPDTHKDSQNWIGKRRGRRKQRCSEVENRESKVGESNQHTPEQKWELNIGFLNVQNLYHILKNKD